MKTTAKKAGRGARRWVHTVTTVSTAPPAGLFTRDAPTIARMLASRRVSPKGITSTGPDAGSAPRKRLMQEVNITRPEGRGFGGARDLAESSVPA